MTLPDGTRIPFPAVRVGSAWYTTRAALRALVVATSAPAPTSDGPQVRTPAERRRASEAAERELARAGI